LLDERRAGVLVRACPLSADLVGLVGLVGLFRPLY